MKTLIDEYACPKCGSSERLDVAISTFARLTNEGTDNDISHDGSHEWDGDSLMKCMECSHSGKACEFSRDIESVE